jgi:DNA-binding transcriptional regulator YiaG
MASRGALPRRIYSWRQKNDLSQSQAALQLGVSVRTLQEWEQGRAQPSEFALRSLNKLVTP